MQENASAREGQIGALGRFRSELRVRRIEAGVPARVMVQNLRSDSRAFTLTHHSPNDALVFDPGPVQELRVPAGQVRVAEFRASPQQRPLFGGEKTYPFTTRVQAADLETQNLTGEVLGRGLIPGWAIPLALVLLTIVACVAALGVFGLGV